MKTKYKVYDDISIIIIINLHKTSKSITHNKHI